MGIGFRLGCGLGFVLIGKINYLVGQNNQITQQIGDPDVIPPIVPQVRGVGLKTGC
jgi:hypothetical protein